MWAKFEFDCVFVETDTALASEWKCCELKVFSFWWKYKLSIVLLITSNITEEVSDKTVISGNADSNVVYTFVGKMASSFAVRVRLVTNVSNEVEVVFAIVYIVCG